MVGPPSDEDRIPPFFPQKNPIGALSPAAPLFILHSETWTTHLFRQTPLQCPQTR